METKTNQQNIEASPKAGSKKTWIKPDFELLDSGDINTKDQTGAEPTTANAALS